MKTLLKLLLLSLFAANVQAGIITTVALLSSSPKKQDAITSTPVMFKSSDNKDVILCKSELGRNQINSNKICVLGYDRYTIYQYAGILGYRTVHSFNYVISGQDSFVAIEVSK